MRARVVTLSYRLIARRRRLGLVAQDALALRGVRGRLIHADVAPREFNDNWSRIPWHMRLAIVAIAPLYGGYRYLTATRESLGKRMQAEDLASSEDVNRADAVPGFDQAILGTRDAKLVAAVEALLAAPEVPTTVAIVYGAAHMKAVTHRLMEMHHYRVTGSEWLTVFDYAAE